MKKLLLSLGTLASVVAPVAAVVACGTSTDADGAKPTTGTDGTSGTKITDGTDGTTGTLGDKVDESKGAAALLQENKDSDIALVKTSTLTEEEQKAAIAKINAAKSTVELGVAFLNLNLVQKDAPTTQTAEQKAAQKAKEAQFAKNQAALKAKIANSKLDRAVQMGLNDQVVAATVQSSLDAIETDFNAKVAAEAAQSKVDPAAILSKEKADAIKEVNALTNLNDYEKEVYGRRINNAANKNVISTILTSAKFEDGKGPQINAADHATKATAFVIDPSKRETQISSSKGIKGDIWVTVKNADFKFAKADPTIPDDTDYFTFQQATSDTTLKITVAQFEVFKSTIAQVYDGIEAQAVAKTKILTGLDLKEAIGDAGIAKAISNKFGWSSGALTTDQSNKDAKAGFEAEEKTLKTQGDIDDLLTRINAFKPVMKPTSPSAVTLTTDWAAKAETEFKAADADHDTYYGYKLAKLSNEELLSVVDEVSYKVFQAALEATKK